MFDVNGYLPAGIHDYDETKFKRDFVTSFPSSVTRGGIFDGYRRHAQEIVSLISRCEQLIDGSFVTNKNDPGDVDLVCFCDKDDVDQLSPADQTQFSALMAGKSTRASHSCDAYFVPTVAPSHPMSDQVRKIRKYWLGEFSFDRTERVKGVVRRVLVP